MPACGGDIGLGIFDGTDSSTEGNPQPLEAALELEPGKLKQLGSLPEADSLVQIVAEHPSLGKITVVAFAGGTKGEGEQEPEVESIQENDALRPSTGDDGELALLHPIQDLSGPLGQVGGGDDGARHPRCLLMRVPHAGPISKLGYEFRSSDSPALLR